MTKYLVNVIKGFETSVDFETVTANDTKTVVGGYSVPWTITPGMRVCRTKREALAYIETIRQGGGEAVFAGKTL